MYIFGLIGKHEKIPNVTDHRGFNAAVGNGTNPARNFNTNTDTDTDTETDADTDTDTGATKSDADTGSTGAQCEQLHPRGFQ